MVGIVGIQFGGGTYEAAFPVYQALLKTRDKQFAAFEKQPSIARDVDYFRENAPKITSIEEFFADRRLMTVALSAYALEDELQYMGRIRKVMSESVSEKDALVNKLIDPRFKALATDFAFGDFGTANLALDSFINKIIDKFKTNEFEKFLGERNPALREAEYFRRNIGAIENTFNILGDKVLRSVVTGALGLPLEIALQSVDKQKDLIDRRVDIADFKDPAFVDKFIRRFLILKDTKDFEAGLGYLASAPNAFALQLFQRINLLV